MENFVCTCLFGGLEVGRITRMIMTSGSESRGKTLDKINGSENGNYLKALTSTLSWCHVSPITTWSKYV